MKVDLLSYTTEPARVIWVAARTCYSAQTPQEIKIPLEVPLNDQEFMECTDFLKLFNHLFVSGHHSVFEHVNYTFMISGVTRQTTHQLVRHRHFSFSQQSMRYVNFDNPSFYGLEKDAGLLNVDLMAVRQDEAAHTYNSLVSTGVPAEDARRILPIGTKTNIVVTANLRALIDFMGNRRCILAQREIFNLANAMREAVRKVHPILSNTLMIKCQKLGYCPEERNVDNGLCSIRPHVNRFTKAGEPIVILKILSVLPTNTEHDKSYQMEETE